MANLVVFVLDNLEQCGDVLDAWEQAGVSGVTILESTGLGRKRSALGEDLPLLPSLKDLLGTQELHHRTLFTVIEDETTVARVIAATEKVVGDFTRHHTGLLFVIPVIRVLGLEKRDR